MGHHVYSKERLTPVSGGYFIDDEHNQPVTSRKTTDRIVSMIKFGLSSENGNFGRLVSATVSLAAPQYLKAFLVRSVMV